MAELPSARLRLLADAAARAAGLNTITIIAPCLLHTDGIPRIYGNAKAIREFHGYCPGVDYAAMHIQETGQAVVFIGVPVATPGTVGQIDQSGNTDTSIVGVAVGEGGSLEEVNGAVVVERGGTVGTDQIRLRLTLDGGLKYKVVNLGTGNQYTIPYINQTLYFAAGDLTDGETVLRWTSSAPGWDDGGLASARAGLVADQIASRSWLVIGDVTSAGAATVITTEVNAYETENDRYVVARGQVYDRPTARLSTSIQTEGPLPFNVVFAASGDTATRAEGSWIADGFREGDEIEIVGTVDNDGTYTIATLSATVMGLGASPGLTDETISSDATGFSITADLSKAEHVAEASNEFEDITGERRLDLSFGRGTKPSPTLGYSLRRPAAWAMSIREYQHDVQIPTWQKEQGPLSGWFLKDAGKLLAEHDERVDGGALAARFSCLRTYSNDGGTYVAQSVTREDENSVLSQTHQMHVSNVVCTVAQREAERFIGKVLVLKSDGSGNATQDSLDRLKARVDSALARAVLADTGEGQRASNVYFTPASDDDLSGSNATLHYTVSLYLLGTLVHVDGSVRVNPTE